MYYFIQILSNMWKKELLQVTRNYWIEYFVNFAKLVCFFLGGQIYSPRFFHWILIQFDFIWTKPFSPCLAFLTTKTKLLKVFSYFVYIRDLDKLNMIWPIFANSLGAPQKIAHFKSDQKWMKTTILLLSPRLSLNPWYTRQEYSIFLFWLLKSNRCKIISKYFGLPPSFLIWFHFFPFQDFPTLK